LRPKYSVRFLNLIAYKNHCSTSQRVLVMDTKTRKLKLPFMEKCTLLIFTSFKITLSIQIYCHITGIKTW
jgi:hypothetical protein